MDATDLKNIAIEARADIDTLKFKAGKTISPEDYVLRRTCERQAKLAEACAELLGALAQAARFGEAATGLMEQVMDGKGAKKKPTKKSAKRPAKR